MSQNEVFTVAAGTVGPASLPRLLGRMFREQANGRLVLEHDGGRSIAFFRKGRPVGVNVYARFKPLALALLEMGAIDVETLDKSLTMKSERDCLHGQVLREMGAVNEEQLLVGLRKQHQANLYALLSIQQGNYTLEAGGELPDWTKAVGLSAQEAVLNHLAHEENIEAVEALIRLLGNDKLVLTSAWKSGWVSFDMNRDEHAAMSLFHEPNTIEVVSGSTDIPEDRVRVLVSAVSCFGLIANAR